jgi:hypothetical protein
MKLTKEQLIEELEYLLKMWSFEHEVVEYDGTKTTYEVIETESIKKLLKIFKEN